MNILATEFSDLNLRPLTRKDSDALFRLTESNRQYLRRWLPWLDLARTLADTRSFVRGSIGRREAGLGLDYGVFLRSEIVGVITFNTLSRLHRSGTIGYWLAELYTRRGLMTASVRRLINYGFGELNLNRIEIRVAVGNQPSQAICDRLGLKQEGILRQAEWLYDHFVDLRVNSVLRSEWKG
jgi:ribosomal-protein-serine acetyltransferase